MVAFSDGDFNAAVKEFMRKLRRRANWCDPGIKDDQPLATFFIASTERLKSLLHRP